MKTYCSGIIVIILLSDFLAYSATLSAPSIACSGDIVTVAWKGITKSDKNKDYIGFWQPLQSTAIYKFYQWTRTGESSGFVNFTNFIIDSSLGPGEFRYCHNDDDYCSHSKSDNLAAVSAPITSCQIGKLVAPDTACNGDVVTVSWIDIQHPGSEDYIGFWQPSESTAIYKFYQWARNGKVNGSVEFPNFVIDEKLGIGEFRYCRNDDDYCGPSKPSNLAAISGPVRVGSDCNIHPIHIHLAWGSTPDQMVVTWSTESPTCSSVQFGFDFKLGSNVTGTMVKFTDGGSEHRVQYIHKVILNDLSSGTKYFYRCGCDAPSIVINKMGWSDIYSFIAMRTGDSIETNFIVFGDLGVSNDQSFPYLKLDVENNFYDALLHVGDFAYNMASDNARVGDTFMNLIQPIAATNPYMVCVGNHEYAYNFTNYRHRFNMPDGPNQPNANENMWFSFNMGPIHFISWSTEVLYWDDQKPYMEKQKVWLENDLKEANTEMNRTKHPWIIAFAHRPFYCSYKGTSEDCTPTGAGAVRAYAEELFYKYGVDIGIWAHEHNYERFFPCYKGQFANGSYVRPYTNPKGTVHFTTGTAGCSEGHDPMTDPWGDLSAFRSVDYGYARMHVYNSTHLHWEEVSVDKKGKVIDSIWVIQESHGPFKGYLTAAHPNIPFYLEDFRK